MDSDLFISIKMNEDCWSLQTGSVPGWCSVRVQTFYLVSDGGPG